MRHIPAARLPAADLTGSGSDRVDSKASSSVSTPTLAAVSPNLTASFGHRLGDGRLNGEWSIELGEVPFSKLSRQLKTFEQQTRGTRWSTGHSHIDYIILFNALYPPLPFNKGTTQWPLPRSETVSVWKWSLTSPRKIVSLRAYPK